MVTALRNLMLCALGLAPLAPAWAAGQVTYDPGTAVAVGGLALVSGDGVRALALDDRRPAWQALPRLQTYPPTAVGQRLFVGSSDGLAALDRASGRLLWRAARGKTVFSPLAVDDTLYAGTLGGELLAIDALSGTERWRRRLDGWVYSPAWSRGQLVAGGSAAALWWIDAGSGSVLRRRDLDQELVAAPVATARGVVARTYAGTLLHFDHRGDPLWRVAGLPGALPPLVVGDELLVIGMDGRLRLRTLDDGRNVWQGRLGSRIVQGPAFAGGEVLLIAESGEAGRLSPGRRRWIARAKLPAAESGATAVMASGRWLLIDAEGRAPSVLPWSAVEGADRPPKDRMKETSR